ncbi:DUF3253 domain-containing protein [Mycobacterium sp. 1165178.9]|uniref:DUF3253 domain-containing protein n=1 Tax=Mycobacterium sp. 1165178.9 TaxID=1834070 RepID=UPI001E4242F5|nr:DUF3253 domain-containing protein [Mycobacterium sp. 1165178.9]
MFVQRLRAGHGSKWRSDGAVALTGGMGDRLRAELGRVSSGGGRGAEHAEMALGDGPMRQRLESAIRALAEHRGPRSSICPSDAARAVGGDNWRELMDDAREAARRLARSGHVEITQRGNVVEPDGEWSGAIRIRRARS